MNDATPSNAADSGYPGFAPPELRTRARSPLNDRAWRLLLLAAGLTCAGAVVPRVWSGGGLAATTVSALLLTAGWVLSVRFLLLDCAWRRVWLGWLGLGAVALIASGSYPAGRYVAIAVAIVFLTMRRYQPYRHLTSGRRARAFGLGLLALILLLAMPDGPSRADAPYPAGLIWNLGLCVRVASILFWIFSLWHLVIHMRLHFMRLRPKLATSAALLGLVPLVLVVLLGLLILYGALGGSRAKRARDTMVAWAESAAAGVDLTGQPFASGFVWSAAAGADRGDVPVWAPHLAAELRAARRGRPSPSGAAAADTAAGPAAGPAAADRAEAGADADEAESRRMSFTIGDDGEGEPTPWLPADTTAYFRIDEETWLLTVAGLAGDDVALRGWPVDQVALDYLGSIVGAEVSFGLGDDADDDFATFAGPGGDAAASSSAPSGALAEQARRWYDRLYFGGALLPLISVDDSPPFTFDDRLLVLQVGLGGLRDDFFGGRQNFNIAWLAVVALVATLFLIIEIFALFFSFRIAAGITAAVGALHRGTERLAAGDLTTRIEVPNEDEFGDLADSFNAMAVAVAQGREDAVARERLLRELETARQIQQRLLPEENPRLAGFEITGASVPSRQVGGDYFDFLAQGDGRMGIAIGDVSGKGMPAALLMANLQASLQGQVIHRSSVAEVVAWVNDLLARSTDPHMFATFFYGVLNPGDGSFTSANAGHNPPILRRADGRIELLEDGGLVLGMLPDQQYRQQTVVLDPGDVLVLYTDGITEATADEPFAGDADDSDGGDDDEDVAEMFGEAALRTVIERNAHLTAVGIKEAILAAVSRFTSGAPQSDDITLVVIKREVVAGRDEENRSGPDRKDEVS